MNKVHQLLGVSLALIALTSCRFGLENSTVGDGGFVVPPGCGDGVIGAGEECDDGNFDNNDSCLENCQLASCGDGVVRRQVEACDDGNDDDNDGCTSACSLCPADPDGVYFSKSNKHCYTRNIVDNDYARADAQCAAQGGRLAALSTSAEHDEVVAALPISEPTWIGFQRNADGWYWLTADAEVFTNWAVGFPDDQAFTLLQPDATWQSSADSPRPFLCEIPSGSAWKVRPDDGHAYRRLGPDVNQEVAAAECRRRGGYLAVISSAEEEVFVRQNIGSGLGSNREGWIALNDIAEEGSFVWGEDESSSFFNWNTGEPNQNGNCVSMTTSWIDRPCTDLIGYYCELD